MRRVRCCQCLHPRGSHSPSWSWSTCDIPDCTCKRFRELPDRAGQMATELAAAKADAQAMLNLAALIKFGVPTRIKVPARTPSERPALRGLPARIPGPRRPIELPTKPRVR